MDMDNEDDFEGVSPVVRALYEGFQATSEQILGLHEGARTQVANLMALNLAVSTLIRLTPGASKAVKDMADVVFTGDPDNPVHRDVRESLEKDLHIPL